MWRKIMVQTNQTTDEYYLTDYTPPDFTANSSYDSDEQFAILMCLALLEYYYENYNNQSPDEILKTITEDMDSLKESLSSEGMKYVEDAVNTVFNKELEDYQIPENTISPEYNYLVIVAGIDALVNQLRDDLKAKAIYYANNLSNSPFNVKPNFERAIKRINDVVGTGLINAKELSHRNVSKFVYGSDALFYWVCKNDAKTCSWCRSQARSDPRPIDEWELDHPYGRCTLKPVNEEFSDDYKLLVGIL